MTIFYIKNDNFLHKKMTIFYIKNDNFLQKKDNFLRQNLVKLFTKICIPSMYMHPNQNIH